jgi:hypothetical protein
MRLSTFCGLRRDQEQLLQCGKLIGVVGNNVEHFSVLWATAQKNVRRCERQRGRIATTYSRQFNIFCEPFSAFNGQFT